MASDRDLLEHAEFRELVAGATFNELTLAERNLLESHLSCCADCREVHRQYLLLVSEGIPVLGEAHDFPELATNRTEGPWRERLFRRVEMDVRSTRSVTENSVISAQNRIFPRSIMHWLSVAAVFALCLLPVSWMLVRRYESRPLPIKSSGAVRTEGKNSALVSSENALADATRQLDVKINEISRMESERTEQAAKLTAMKLDLKRYSENQGRLVDQNSISASEINRLVEDRENLQEKIKEAEQHYSAVEDQLLSLRRERDASIAKNLSLEAEVRELNATSKNQQRQIAEDEQFLNSDRDIRELMGARQLYIADVFDVDSRSHTRPPFGRIFYTHGKSLIIYAFDLDNQKDSAMASAFQVWGKGSDTQTPLSLGILYLDNEKNRRWLLRSDDSEQLGKIDSVFVTVEPKGGSREPTGKPFLYALLRKEVNHP
jgi:hypothetical protein